MRLLQAVVDRAVHGLSSLQSDFWAAYDKQFDRVGVQCDKTINLICDKSRILMVDGVAEANRAAHGLLDHGDAIISKHIDHVHNHAVNIMEVTAKRFDRCLEVAGHAALVAINNAGNQALTVMQMAGAGARAGRCQACMA